MQKRVGRPVDSYKIRKNLKSRQRFAESIKDGLGLPFEYFRLGLIWLTIIGLDFATGIRFELLWPFAVVTKACWESLCKDKNLMTTLANTNTSHMTMLFVCITATADLICYLFIPIQWMIFLSCTYVWLNLLWATYGGFLVALSTLSAERSRAAPLLFTTGLIIFFEYCVRLRCDLTAEHDSEHFLHLFLRGQGCDYARGAPKTIPSGINSFFGAHCIGYPFILISLSFRYYLREWSIKRRETKVSRRNEQFNRVLTEALPAIYEGPRDYSVRTPILDEECDLLGSSLDLQPMIMAPPIAAATAASSSSAAAASCNGNSRKASTKGGGGGQANGRNRQSSRNKTNHQHTPPMMKNGAARRGGGGGDDAAYEDDSDEFNESDERQSLQSRSSSGSSGSLFFMRPVEWLFSILHWVFSSQTTPMDGEEQPEPFSDDYKKRNGVDNNKNHNRVGVQPRKGRAREKPKEKVVTAQALEREKVIQNLPMNGGPKMPETRDSSRDTSLSTTTTSRISVSMEVERLKSEINHLRNAEQDSKLQLVAAKNTENQLRSENTSLKASVERSENKVKVLEKQRDGNITNMTQLEKKYAELLNKKNDVERELNAERKARKEDGGKKEQTTEQLREKEREQDALIEKLKHESAIREDRFQILQQEIVELRKYKEGEALEKDDEIRVLKSRIAGLEESLQSENKLKQDLFRALGDARTHNAQLEDKLRSSHELSVNVHHAASVSEKSSPTQTVPVNSPPSYNMAMQHPKCDPIGQTYLYAAMQQHHSSPTGEHLLFEQSAPSMMSPLPASIHDNILANRMGKFGAPANPTRIN